MFSHFTVRKEQLTGAVCHLICGNEREPCILEGIQSLWEPKVEHAHEVAPVLLLRLQAEAD